MDQYSEDNKSNERRKALSDRRRSIRDVSLSEEIGAKRRPARPTRPSAEKSYYKRGSNAARYGVMALLVVVILFGGIFTMSALARATINIEPRSEKVSVSEEVAISESDTEGVPLSYEIFSLEENSSKEVEGGEEKRVERSAQGKITIYNLSTKDEALIEKTRFESESGKIYRISSSVIVPAAKSGNPGSLTVSVTASEVGEDSNLSKGKLNIPGLEGTELYSKMYAEVSSAIEGGYVGIEKAVSESDERKARKDIEGSLATSLQQKATSSLPVEYVLVPDSLFVEFTELPNESTGSSVSVRTQGTIYGIMLKKDLLASYLASQNLKDYDNSPLEVKNLESLKLSLNKKQLTLRDLQGEVTLSIKGEAVLKWKVDIEHLKEAVSGASKTEAGEIIKSTPGVRRAHLGVIPSFLRTIPTNLEKIDVIVSDEL